tara:strand:+ start:95 stop:310 length:216 start_codon:yes stop_codon:yes gene_type:complete
VREENEKKREEVRRRKEEKLIPQTEGVYPSFVSLLLGSSRRPTNRPPMLTRLDFLNGEISDIPTAQEYRPG